MDNSSSHSSNGLNIREFSEESKISLSPFEHLVDEHEQINPAIILAEELMRKDLSEILNFTDFARAEEILEYSSLEIEAVAKAFESLIKTPGFGSEQITPGF